MSDFNLTETLSQRLTHYSASVSKCLRKSVDVNSEKLQKGLKRDSPKRKSGKKRSGRYTPGSYARSWVNDVTTDSFSVYERQVYNKKHYQLTHLLENGHAKRGGGRVSPRVHIAPLQKQAEKELKSDIMSLIKNIKNIK